MRQVFTRVAHAIVLACILSVVAAPEVRASRFLDDRDFQEAIARPPPPVVESTRPPDEELEDPAEELNRPAHLLNQQIRRFFFDPLVEAYLSVTSPPVRKGVDNVFANLREPVWLVGHLLKGDWDGARTTATRFALNSTLGMGGVYDEATGYGLMRQKTTLDEVFCSYGIGSGPYVVLPVLGPSSVRDAVGRTLTMAGQYAVLGIYLVPYRIADLTVQYMAVRDDIRYLERQSLDTYAAERSVFMQLNRLTCDQRPDIESRLFAR